MVWLGCGLCGWSLGGGVGVVMFWLASLGGLVGGVVGVPGGLAAAREGVGPRGGRVGGGRRGLGQGR